MPRKNFENIGDLQNYELLRGVISSAPDADTDTCTLLMDSVSYTNVPIYYHCMEDSEERANGAIQGAAAGFAQNDAVVVLKQRAGLEDKIFIIGRIAGAAHCCWLEPWNGPLINSKYPWEFINSAPVLTPEEDRFAASIADGLLTIQLPAQTIAGSHIGYASLETPAELGGYVKETATRARVVCSEISAVCSADDGDPLTYSGPSQICVIFDCARISDGSSVSYRIFFFSDKWLDGVPANGYWCSALYGPNYLYEYAAMHEVPDAYFVYLPHGVENAVWINFLEAVRVNSVYAFCASIYGKDEGSGTYVLPAREMLAVFDSIEIC